MFYALYPSDCCVTSFLQTWQTWTHWVWSEVRGQMSLWPAQWICRHNLKIHMVVQVLWDKEMHCLTKGSKVSLLGTLRSATTLSVTLSTSWLLASWLRWSCRSSACGRKHPLDLDLPCSSIRSPGFPDAERWMIVTALSALSVTSCIPLIWNRPGVANQEELGDSQRARLVVGSKRPMIRNRVGAVFSQVFFPHLDILEKSGTFNIIRSPMMQTF